VTAIDCRRSLLARACIVVLCLALEAACSTRPEPETATGRTASIAAGQIGDDARADALVDPTLLDPSILIDIRYATPANFTGVAVYPVARCLLRRDVAERLLRVQRALRREGVGVKLWDCYRPFSVQLRFWKLVPDPRYVAEPVVRDGRPVAGSKHNRGAAVDLTLVDGLGRELEMPSAYDDFTERAHRDFAGASEKARRNAGRLEAAMVAEGFLPLPTEWWHFDGPGWEAYDISDEPLN